MEKQQFKAESKRLLDLMINSIYTHKEIFLRELISNASDAIDKRYYKSLSDNTSDFNKDDFYIRIETDKDNRILTISDTGIGMTKEELATNLGTIAKSGSFDFKSNTEPKDGVDIIGQFGVGFYSAFMVADSITVITKSENFPAYEWKSEGADGYTITESSKDDIGTIITLNIKENTDDNNYDEFLNEYNIKSLVKKYSNFIKYPIKMETLKSKLKEKVDENEKDEYIEYYEDEILNSMVPIWRRNKNELTDEDYENFYMDKHYGYDKPIKYSHISVEGLASYNAILYIPEKTPFDFYTKEYEKGLELYSNGVLIMNKCSDLLPDYFGFVQGLVDSADLSLNISRELLQHDRQLQFIAKKIKEKIKSELLDLQKNERDKYESFFSNFGRTIKYGVYNQWGADKEFLQDLLVFVSSFENKFVTLNEYISRMKENQKYIYYACGDNIEKISKLPQSEFFKDKGYEILYFTDEIDEFAIKMLLKYDEKEFKNISSSDIEDTESESSNEEKNSIEENNDILAFIKDSLSGKVNDVKVSKKLKSHPVCLSSEGDLSIEMEKVLNAMPDNQGVHAQKILEINTNHQIYKIMKDAFDNDKEKLKTISFVLYNQALLIEGLSIEDPIQYANDIYTLIK